MNNNINSTTNINRTQKFIYDLWKLASKSPHKKIEISNIRRKYSRINEKIYNLDNFDDQLEVLNQFRAYISNTTSNKNALDFSLNKE